MSKSFIPPNASSRPCPCCDGSGTVVKSADGGGATDGVFDYDARCEECDGTGQKWTTGITTPSGATAIIHGSAPLGDEAQAALSRVVEAAFKSMGSE